jgi:hypothetical protein
VSGTWYTSSLRGGIRARLLAAFVGSNPTVYTILGKRKAHMKKIVLTVIMLVSTVVNAESAYDKFRTDDGKYPTVVVTYRSVDNVQQACDAENRKRDGRSFGFKLNACSFRDIEEFGGKPLPTCLIIVARIANYHTYGHELRHCFVGQFHQ